MSCCSAILSTFPSAIHTDMSGWTRTGTGESLYSEIKCNMGNGHMTTAPWTEWQTDTYENITFQQLWWLAMWLICNGRYIIMCGEYSVCPHTCVSIHHIPNTSEWSHPFKPITWHWHASYSPRIIFLNASNSPCIILPSHMMHGEYDVQWPVFTEAYLMDDPIWCVAPSWCLAQYDSWWPFCT